MTVTVENFEALKGKKELHLQIKAKVNADIKGGDKIENKATIDYETGDKVTPEPDDKTTTPPVTVVVTSGGITLKKIDGETKEALQGAKFKLQDKDGNIVKVNGVDVVGESDKDGMIRWGEIPYGEYEIVEIEAPTYKNDKGEVKSYQKLREPIKVKIDKDNQTVKLTVENNKSGWILPATGGIGTILFTVVGLILMGAAFMFLRRKA